MAFMPFHFFRKRLKLFMAAMVFIAMFSFIFMDAVGSGQDIGARWAKRIRGIFGVVDDQIANVDGQGYDLPRIHALHNQRRKSLEYVLAVQRKASDNIHAEAGFTKEDLATEDRYKKREEEVRKNNPDALKPLETPPLSLAVEAIVTPVRDLNARIQNYDDIQRYIRFGIDPSALGIRNIEPPKVTDSPFHVESLIDFFYWLNKADELGVVMSAEKVKQDLIRAGFSRIKEADLLDVTQRLKLGVDTDTVMGWIADEIRVMMARGMVFAPDRFTGSLLAAQVTPLDLWNAYAEVKRQLTVGVLTLRVNDPQFLTQVPLPPQGDTEKWKEFNESKLKPFFEQYKNQEPDPARDTPGFKIPKKHQIEFFYADLRANTDARKHYEKWAGAQDGLFVAAQLLGTLGLPLPTVEAERAVALYTQNKMRGRYRLPDDLQSTLIAGVQLADGSRYVMPLPAGPGPFGTGPGVERQTLAQHIIDVAGALSQLQATPFGIGAVLRPTPRKVHRTLPQAQSLELAAAAASAGLNLGVVYMNPALLGFAARVDYAEQSQPFADVAASIYDEMIEDQCRTLLDRDLLQVTKEMEAYGKLFRTDFDKWKRLKTSAEAKGLKLEFIPPLLARKEGDKEVKEPVKDYLTRFARNRGLVYEGMKEPRGPYDLFNEKDVTPLSTILRPVFMKALPLESRRPDDSIRAALIGVRGLYEPAPIVRAPNPMRDGSKPWEFVLHWKVAETEARLPTFTEAEVAVLEAWKLREARALVEEHANTLANQVKTDDGYRILLDKEGYQPEKLLSRFEAAGPLNYRKANLTYLDAPPDDVLDQALTKMQTKGDTLVFANKSKSIYYLLVLKSREEPKATDRTALAFFDLNVAIQNPAQQLRVEGEAISQWVQRDRTRAFLKEWDTYFRARTSYNSEEADRAMEALRSAANRN